MKNEKKKDGFLSIKAKGEPGYITSKKRIELTTAIILFLIAAGIFVLGLALNKWEKGNIFTIIAALFIIPMAKFVTGYILFFPFKSVDPEKVKEVEKSAKAGSLVFSDVVITSEKVAMGLDFLVVTGDKILGITSREKEDVLDIRNYLQDKITRQGHDYKVSITDEFKKFTNMLKSSDCVAELTFDSEEDREYFEKDRNEVLELLISLMP